MNPSPSAIAAIKAKVTDWSQTDAAIAATLNTPTIPNPQAQPQVPVTIQSAQVLGRLSAASVANLNRSAAFAEIRNDIKAGALQNCLEWIQWSLTAGDITADEAGKIQTYLNSTVPDPTWQAQLSWAQTTLGRPVDNADIWTARNS